MSRFKSFRRADLIVGPLTVLIGTNASGKSNLRDAFRFLHGVGQGYSLAEILGGKHGPEGILWRGIRGGASEVAYYGEGSFTVGVNYGRWARYDLTVDVRGARPAVNRESLYWGGHRIFDSHPDDDVIHQPQQGSTIKVRLPRGGNHRKHGPALELFNGEPVLHQFIERVRSDDELRRLTRLRAAVECRDLFRSIRFLDLSPAAIRQPSVPGIDVLGDRGENLSSVLQLLCEDSAREDILLEWVRALTPLDAVDFRFPTDHSGKILVHLVEKGGHAISANSASDGTLRFLAMATALLSQSGTLFFFEEIDNGLHPTRLHLLLDLITQACKSNEIQVLATSHNPMLLTFLDAETRKHAALIYRGEGRPDSQIVRIIELPHVKRVLKSQDLGRLHASGWLEDAVAFADDDPDAHTGAP